MEEDVHTDDELELEFAQTYKRVTVMLDQTSAGRRDCWFTVRQLGGGMRRPTVWFGRE